MDHQACPHFLFFRCQCPLFMSCFYWSKASIALPLATLGLLVSCVYEDYEGFLGGYGANFREIQGWFFSFFLPQNPIKKLPQRFYLFIIIFNVFSCIKMFWELWVCVCAHVYKWRTSQIIYVFVGCSLWDLISLTRDWTQANSSKKSGILTTRPSRNSQD